MKNKNNKLSMGVALFFGIIIIFSALYSIIMKKDSSIGKHILALIILTVPFILTGICKAKDIRLPSSFPLVMVIFIFATQYLGEILGLYHRFWWWDLLLHGIFGSYVVIVALFITEDIITKKEGISSRRFILFTAMIAFCISITLGTVWEVFEYAGDYFFKTHMVKGGLKDTITDISIKMFSALITVIIYLYQQLKKQNNA